MSLVRSTGQAINIIESGSNENGNWVKFDDGTMVQYYCNPNMSLTANIVWGNIFRSQDYQITLPLAFINTNFHISFNGSLPKDRFNILSENIFSVNFWHPTAITNYAGKFSYVAVGRWK